MAVSFDKERLGRLKDTVAVVGVGETDYGADYRGAGGKAAAKGEARYDHYTLASRALKRALDDAGLKKDEIDGLCVGPTLSEERASELWDLDALAVDCAADGRYEFMLVSAPLYVPGGVGSPPNAYALK